jgi:hypothetical protein
MPKRGTKKPKKPVKHHVVAEFHEPLANPEELAHAVIPAFTEEPVVVVALPKSAWQKFLDWIG